MANNSKLDMSLDSLIKNQRNKPTGQQKGKLVQQKQQGKGTFQSQQKGGFKAKGAAPQQQKGMQMKAKGGVAKPGSAGRAGGAKVITTADLFKHNHTGSKQHADRAYDSSISPWNLHMLPSTLTRAACSPARSLYSSNSGQANNLLKVAQTFAWCHGQV